MILRYKLAGVLLAALAGYGAWLGLLRTLPLFEVQTVTISGLPGNAAPQIASTLALTAREMTTTDFSTARLRDAVAGYNTIESVRASTQFPHGAKIAVVERRPLVRLIYGGGTVAVAADDLVLADVDPSHSLPLVRAVDPPVAGRVTDSLDRAEIALLAAAPAVLRRQVFAVRQTSEGLTVRLRGGPLVYFGDSLLPHAKWDATAAVLASGTARGARYIDVSLPSRPAAAVDDPATSTLSAGATAPSTGAQLP
ncbi:MAG: hypothetical protein ABSC56_12455 [Solirubrobacteraceae bacterium]